MLRFCVYLLLCLLPLACHASFPFMNVSLSWEDRVEDLASRLTLQEMIGMMAWGGGGSSQPQHAIPRLGLKPYQFDTECLQGVISSNATAFPMSIGYTAMFSPKMMYRVAEVISIEARALGNGAMRRGDYSDFKGLSCLAPFINIVRHPLWGRIVEVFGEDPYLSGVAAQQYVKGVHGEHPRYVRISSGCKVVSVHSGPENIPVSRLTFDAKVTERDYRLTYLPNVKMCIEAGTFNLMCSYNSINGVPACANKNLLTDILRDEFGFNGYYISDEGAIENIFTQHKYVNSSAAAAAAAVNAGVNLELPDSPEPYFYTPLQDAVRQGMVSPNTIKARVKPLLYTRMRLGEFDPPSMNPYVSINPSVVQSAEHREVAIQAAIKSFVLLKNQGNVLPLKKKYSKIAIIGPMASNIRQQYGTYSPKPYMKYVTTPLTSLQKIAASSSYAAGCGKTGTPCTQYNATEVKNAVKGADVVIICLGTGMDVEREGMDRSSLDLPGKQFTLLQDAVAAAESGVPVILLLFTAGPVDINWAVDSDKVPVIMQCWIPGQGAGEALLRVLTAPGGQVTSPAGRLPYTWPKSLDLVPPMTDYSMEGRTYRYLTDTPRYSFGYGLSYSSFKYSNIDVMPEMFNPLYNATVNATVIVTNTGNYESDEVVQVYIRWLDTEQEMPRMQLVAFDRVFLRPSQALKVTLPIKAEQMQVYDDTKGFTFEQGRIQVLIGGQLPFDGATASYDFVAAYITVSF